MQDFIFGTLSTDDLKLVYHRSSRQGLQHDYRIKPLDPEVNKPVTISVMIGPEVQVDQVACYYTVDGSQPVGVMEVAKNGHIQPLKKVGVEWDNFIWGYTSLWETDLPPQPEGTVVRYRIGAWSKQNEEIFCDWPDVKSTQEEAARAFFHKETKRANLLGEPGRGDIFNYHVDRLKPPQWAREGVIYHIFVDRFNPGRGNSWDQTIDLKGFFGGTIWGILEKLDYISGLGATSIWLSPIFSSPTTHGYDATDYESIEPRLGGEASFRALIKEAHSRGIRVILDLVCNHLSNQHPIFQDAQANPGSPYRKWFSFDDSPIGYRTYFGVRTMPQINLANRETKEWMLDIARYWLKEFDVDGFRLDHANGPGPGFWSDFWAACKEAKDDVFCFGEIVEDPASIRRFIGRMDGALDFHLADAIRRTYAYRTWDEDTFSQFIDHHLSYFSADFLMLCFLDNHDMDRCLFSAGNDKDLLRKAAAIQMQLPGPPVIYYGTEVGMSQTVSKSSEVGLEASRMAMPWGDDRDDGLLEYYKSIIHDRKISRPWIKRK